MNRAEIEPIQRDIPAARQEAARHYGVHPYFTRRPSNVVRAYVKHYSCAGDVVLDPFGGSGVTAIEAMLLGRRAIHNDLNPFANFITTAIADTSLESTVQLREAFRAIGERCYSKVKAVERATDTELNGVLNNVSLPENIRLPRSSDAEFFYDLFTPRQLAGLALIKNAIDVEPSHNLRRLLLLAWSASVAKLNKTFLSAKGRAESRGGSSIFSIYRYKLASDIVELPIWETFEGRFANVIAAKNEILRIRDYSNVTGAPQGHINSHRQLTILSQDAADLMNELGQASVDYIFTDPPYGGHIAYLDLSILWNHWLGFSVKNSDAEAIVGGELRFSEDHYKAKLRDSIRQCVELLRPERWLTVVFQHWDVSYFQVILDAVAEEGGVLKAAITHDKDVIWSMHKKKNAENVLGGEMLLTFYKPKERARVMRESKKPSSLDELLDEYLPGLPTTGFRTESLFNKLTIGAWERQSLQNLAVDAQRVAQALRRRGWEYDIEQHIWTKNTSESASELALADR